MQVSSRHHPRSTGSGRATPSRSTATYPSAEARELVRAFANELNSSDPRQVTSGRADLWRLLDSAQGPYLGPDELAAALREEIDHGVLGGSPEARVELARYLSTHDGQDEATSRLFDACRIVADIASSDRPEARARASAVNRSASILFHGMNDHYNGEARDAVSRFYSTPATRRFAGDRIPKVPKDAGNWEPGDVMHAPWPKIPVPPRLQVVGREGEPQAPPKMEGKPYPPMQALDLANQIGTFVGAMRNLNELSTFLARCERAYVSRNFLTAPLRPDALRSLRASVDEKLRSADPEIRRVGEELYRTLDFKVLEECSKAYWGVGW